jgi:hypothetical protein
MYWLQKWANKNAVLNKTAFFYFLFKPFSIIFQLTKQIFKTQEFNSSDRTGDYPKRFPRRFGIYE